MHKKLVSNVDTAKNTQIIFLMIFWQKLNLSCLKLVTVMDKVITNI